MNWLALVKSQPIEPAVEAPEPKPMNAESNLARGAKAKQLLDDEFLQEGLREVALTAHRLFEAAQTQEQLQRARDLFESANTFARWLRSWAELGKAESAKREREIAKGRRVERDPILKGMAWRA